MGHRSCAGGAFELVSCPHYLGEVVIYAGLAVALAGRRVTAWLMLLWVVSRGAGGWQRSSQGRVCGAAATCSPFCRFLTVPTPSSPRCPHPHAAQVSNLSLAAGMTHRWYRQHFKTYPAHRRAIFPLLF